MARKETVTSEPINIFGRLSFPKLDKPTPFEEGQDPRWEATTLLDPASKQGLESIKLVIQTASTVAKGTWGFVPIALKRLAHQIIPGAPAPDPKAKEDDIKLRFYLGDTKADANPETYSSYVGMLVVPAHNSAVKPRIVNRRGVTVAPGEDQWPYAGCYTMTRITIWGQDNKYAKALGVNLRGVQFDRDGEPFGASGDVPEAEFAALEDSGAPVESFDFE